MLSMLLVVSLLTDQQPLAFDYALYMYAYAMEKLNEIHGTFAY